MAPHKTKFLRRVKHCSLYVLSVIAALIIPYIISWLDATIKYGDWHNNLVFKNFIIIANTIITCLSCYQTLLRVKNAMALTEPPRKAKAIAFNAIAILLFMYAIVILSSIASPCIISGIKSLWSNFPLPDTPDIGDSSFLTISALLLSAVSELPSPILPADLKIISKDISEAIADFYDEDHGTKVVTKREEREREKNKRNMQKKAHKAVYKLWKASINHNSHDEARSLMTLSGIANKSRNLARIILPFIEQTIG